MAWVAVENFDSYSNGNLAGNNGGTGWSGAWAQIGGGYDGQVEDSLVLQGTKSVSVTPNTGSDRQLTRNLTTTQTSGVVQYLIRKTSNSNVKAWFLLRDATNANTLCGVGLWDDGNIVYLSANNANIGNIQAYSADTTYKIGIEFDCGTDQFRVNVNDGAFGSWQNFGQNRTSCGGIMWNFSDGTASTVYFDYITPYAVDAPATVPDMRTFFM